jgi:hypothetical protein
MRQEKARLLAANIDIDAAVSSAGKLSAEEERLMLERLRSVNAEAAEVRAVKVRAQAEADAAEAEFNVLRFAAGVSGVSGAAPAGAHRHGLEGRRGGTAHGTTGRRGSGDMSSSRALAAAQEREGHGGEGGGRGVGEEGEEGGGEPLVFAEPDPEAVIARFSALEMEMKQIEGQVGDYTARLRTLRSRHTFLLAAKQPTARDARDEVDTNLTAIDRLAAKGEAAKRALVTSREELREAESIKMQLQQSIGMLTQ